MMHIRGHSLLLKGFLFLGGLVGVASTSKAQEWENIGLLNEYLSDIVVQNGDTIVETW